MRKFIGNNPITLTERNFIKDEQYYITKKLDGKRYLLYFSEDGVSRVSSKNETEKVSLPKSSKNIPGTVLDTEYYKGKYYVFDILFFKDTDKRYTSLKERIKLYNHITDKVVKSKKLVSKKYYKTKDMCVDFPYMIRKYHKDIKLGELDGLILTPLSSYYSPVYKWKPVELLSIDFKIKRIKKNNKLLYHLLTPNGSLFAPKNKKYSDVGILDLSEEPEVYKKYKDNSVVEFVFKDDTFVPIRARPDKKNSNGMNVILDNFTEIIRPTDLNKLFCLKKN